MADLALGLLIVVAMAGAVMAVVLRKVFYNLLGFALAIVGLAGVSLMLGSEFVALMQMLIFLGGIAVAMVFAVMMSTPREQQEEGRPPGRTLAAGAVALGFSGVLAWLMLGTAFPTAPAGAELFATDQIGRLLLTRFALPFEAISLLLLAAIIGAVVIARRTREPEDEGDG